MKNALLFGKAGEYFVCYDLSTNGVVAYTSDQGLGYDVVADVEGRLLKIQVKTTTMERSTSRNDALPTYVFHTKRCGKGGKKSYADGDCDMVAFVSLLDKEVAYMPISDLGMTTVFRVGRCRGKYSDEISAVNRARISAMRESGMKLQDIANELGTSKSNIGHILRREPNSRPARYFTDFPFDIACKRIDDSLRQGKLL